MAVYLLGTLDTKGAEVAFVRDRLHELAVEVVVVDCGCLGTPSILADVPRADVFRAAGVELLDCVVRGDRGEAVTWAARGAERIVQDAYAQGVLEGVFGLGGSAGSSISSAAMRSLPIGVPKVLVSTMASGQVRPYVGDKDILLLNSIVDIAGINRVSRRIFAEAAAAMAGMVRFHSSGSDDDRPLIAASMFGVTTPCVQRAREVLEAAGYEVLVFHATGSGGQAMESLIRDGLVSGVLDVTTTELADELVGGVLTAGPARLTAAAAAGVPQVVSVGALDMVNFRERPTVPEAFRSRQFHVHNPTITLMRTTSAENAQLGEEIARKVGAARGPASILLPLQGVSALDCAGQPFDDPVARTALFNAIRGHAPPLDVREYDLHINDPAFAEACAARLLELIAAHPPLLAR
ncbi:MAG: Tm-1-like ATP-binding domain-containing protein [Pirellulaceae bacterium]